MLTHACRWETVTWKSVLCATSARRLSSEQQIHRELIWGNTECEETRDREFMNATEMLTEYKHQHVIFHTRYIWEILLCKVLWLLKLLLNICQVMCNISKLTNLTMSSIKWISVCDVNDGLSDKKWKQPQQISSVYFEFIKRNN